jgi:hypothetical protein
MDYNQTKGGVDNLDKLVIGYSCKRRGGQFRQAGDWLQLQKENPTLVTCDILQHLGHPGVQLVCHVGGVETRLKQREASGETALSQGAEQEIGKTRMSQEDSGAGCWCPIRPTHRTNNSNTGSKCE